MRLVNVAPHETDRSFCYFAFPSLDIYTGGPYYCCMTFEWHDDKAAENVVMHGVRFDYAARVFLDP
ncbi:MAG: hypothetical protein ETSY2_00600 [Candidatus Entotheonella gemina]|uniref:Uncharacterized protein n=1 Tax=Candidatus Entotheonella gemina TaxID=1429439 RepID=W4MH40_9BACT|nr:MAG: hypothetical protein ETSY2_00600 [Candidatus Entotheonella gemina]